MSARRRRVSLRTIAAHVYVSGGLGGPYRIIVKHGDDWEHWRVLDGLALVDLQTARSIVRAIRAEIDGRVNA